MQIRTVKNQTIYLRNIQAASLEHGKIAKSYHMKINLLNTHELGKLLRESSKLFVLRYLDRIVSVGQNVEKVTCRHKIESGEDDSFLLKIVGQ